MRPASPAYPISSPAPVVVGSGGAGGVDGGTAGSGSNSTFGTGPMTLIGKGGGGGTSYDGPVYPGRPGGSGAGEHQDHQVVVDLQHNQVHMVQELIMEIEEETMLMDLVAVGHQQEEVVQVVKE